MNKSNTARNVDEYLARVPEPARAMLEKLRKTIKSVVPKSEEVISYQIPTVKYKGRGLVAFGAFKEHCSLFPMSKSVIAAHREELKNYETSKGTIRFSLNTPLPTALIRKLVKARIAENEARAKE